MDFQDAPDIDMADDKRKMYESEVRQFVQKHDRAMGRKIRDLQKAGYSIDEIERILAF